MFFQQPPVGNPIYFPERSELNSQLDAFFASYQHSFYASGTAALAAAIIAAKRFKPVEQPEVVFPAYGCPDMISAAVFAGVKPVLVDLERDRPWMNLEQLANKLNKRTVAIVAVDLFGIPERFNALRELTNSVEAVLIEDSAQRFPGTAEAETWYGDLVAISFGRGKPVSLLGGGAVLHQGHHLAERLPETDVQATNSWLDHAKYRFKAFLYNRLISPRFYWIPQSLPFLHLGETRYHPLHALGTLHPAQLALLPVNLFTYRNQLRNLHALYSKIFAELNIDGSQLINLPDVTTSSTALRLLRYPLLVQPGIREPLYRDLRRAGLGPSLMYPAPLPRIPGLEDLLKDQGDFSQAKSFAERILTLPTHNSIVDRDLTSIRSILESFFR